MFRADESWQIVVRGPVLEEFQMEEDQCGAHSGSCGTGQIDR